MARIIQECEARIKDSADIVELIGRYIQLRRAGNSWKACCPFHQEKTPSMHVNPTRQSFHCFGCGVGGDSVKFMMLFENLSYPDALRRLADMNGIQIVEEEESPEMLARRHMRKRVVEANALATEYFHTLLCKSPAAEHVRAYLKSRQINIEMARNWQLGWAPHDFREFEAMARGRNIKREVLVEAYLMAQGNRGAYPVFRDRLMFPIHNVRGEVVGFSGRVMDDASDPRKYVNTSDTIAFHKGELLFGLHRATGAIAKADMTVIVCEGQIDVLACHEKAGIRHVVAGLGTAFTEGHAQILRKYAKRAILCYDGDNAGIKASEKTFRQLAAAGLDVWQAELPQGEDPDSLIVSQGAEALQDMISKARPYLEQRSIYELRRTGNDPAARATLIANMADLASTIVDPSRRDVSVVDLATRLHTGLDMLRQQVNSHIDAHKKAQKTQRSMPHEQRITLREEDIEERPVQAASIHPAIRGLIELAASNLEAQTLLVNQIEELQDAITLLPGGEMLQKLLEKLPPPGDEASWQAYLATLTPSQVISLRDVVHEPIVLTDASMYVIQACENTARATIQVQIDTLRARSLSPDLKAHEQLQCIAEITKLQRLLNQ